MKFLESRKIMKKTILILVTLLLLFLSGCSNPCTVTLDIDERVSQYLDIDLEYQLPRPGTFYFPDIQSGIIDNSLITNETDGVMNITRHEVQLCTFHWEDVDGNKIQDYQEGVQVFHNTTFVFKWATQTYKFKAKLFLNGGKISSFSDLQGNILILPTPTKENYIFKGWYENEQLVGKTVTQIKLYSFAEEPVLYAKFSLDPLYVKNLIMQIPKEVTGEDLELLNFIKSQYNQLAHEDRAYVTNYKKLLDALDKINSQK
jgi:uncharacterized repeat protein (TIGR02543 family)